MSGNASSSAAKRYRLKPDVAFQSLGAEDESVVLALQSGQLYTCNGTTTFLLTALREGNSLGEAARAMTESYEVEEAQALEDLEAMAGQLASEGLIEEIA